MILCVLASGMSSNGVFPCLFLRDKSAPDLTRKHATAAPGVMSLELAGTMGFNCKERKLHNHSNIMACIFENGVTQFSLIPGMHQTKRVVQFFLSFLNENGKENNNEIEYLPPLILLPIFKA